MEDFNQEINSLLARIAEHCYDEIDSFTDYATVKIVIANTLLAGMINVQLGILNGFERNGKLEEMMEVDPNIEQSLMGLHKEVSEYYRFLTRNEMI